MRTFRPTLTLTPRGFAAPAREDLGAESVSQTDPPKTCTRAPRSRRTHPRVLDSKTSPATQAAHGLADTAGVLDPARTARPHMGHQPCGAAAVRQRHKYRPKLVSPTSNTGRPESGRSRADSAASKIRDQRTVTLLRLRAHAEVMAARCTAVLHSASEPRAAVNQGHGYNSERTPRGARHIYTDSPSPLQRPHHTRTRPRMADHWARADSRRRGLR